MISHLNLTQDVQLVIFTSATLHGRVRHNFSLDVRICAGSDWPFKKDGSPYPSHLRKGSSGRIVGLTRKEEVLGPTDLERSGQKHV